MWQVSLHGDRAAEAGAAWGQLQHEPAMEQYGLRGEGGPASPQNISLGSKHGVQLLAHREPCRFRRQRKQLDVKILKRSVQNSWPVPSPGQVLCVSSSVPRQGWPSQGHVPSPTRLRLLLGPWHRRKLPAPAASQCSSCQSPTGCNTTDLLG